MDAPTKAHPIYTVLKSKWGLYVFRAKHLKTLNHCKRFKFAIKMHQSIAMDVPTKAILSWRDGTFKQKL